VVLRAAIERRRAATVPRSRENVRLSRRANARFGPTASGFADRTASVPATRSHVAVRAAASAGADAQATVATPADVGAA
jgi:hypothetical protein